MSECFATPGRESHAPVAPCDDDALQVEIDGIDSLVSFQSSFRVPLDHLRGATTEAAALTGLYKGIQNIGTHIPGLVAAASYFTSTTPTGSPGGFTKR